MKTIYLVGKFNTVTQDISSNLDRNFNVQLCSENVEFLKGMLDVEEPDLILINLSGMDRSSFEVFEELKYGYSYIPVFCMGTESEQAVFSNYIGKGPFRGLDSSLSGQMLVNAIFFRLQTPGSSYSPAETVTLQENAAATAGKATEQRAAPAASEWDFAPQPQVKDNATKREGKKHILLVDDNVIQLRSMRGILQNLYDVSMATSGAEAIIQIGKKKPDLIFLDYEMPVCDGKMTLEMIRSIEGAGEIPVVFLTGMNDAANIAAVLKLKPAGYLLKPANTEKIMEIIQRLIEN